MKYLACVLVACVAWIGGTASAAPTGVVDMGAAKLDYHSTGQDYHTLYVRRFSDVGPSIAVNCYAAVWGDHLELQCLQVKP